jgi:hypothetical protein
MARHGEARHGTAWQGFLGGWDKDRTITFTKKPVFLLGNTGSFLHNYGI